MTSMAALPDEPRYQIKVVCDQTGIRPVTLRAWERRYQFLNPGRSDGNYRLYSERDVALLLQGSLFFTRIHVNKWWTFVQEFSVLIHGTLVALAQAGPTGFWPMFFFGFLGIFVITQMHGLGLARGVRWLLAGLYVAAAAWVYAGRGLAQLNEIVRIPLIEYLAVFVLAALFWGGLQVARLLRGAPGGGTLKAASSRD